MTSIIGMFLSLAMVLWAPNASAQTAPLIDSYLQNASGAEVQEETTPSPVDLLFDADSYVPPFYRGRALPSPGTNVHLHALARFAGAGGTAVPESKITYTWRRDGRVVGDVSGLGRASVTLPAPTLFGTDTISVEASAADGSIYGGSSITISSIDPVPTLYQNHPLFGIEYYSALTDEATVPDVEMTFAAVPYFAAAVSPSDPQLTWRWSVNGEPIATSVGGSEITINAENSSGLAAISLLLTSPANFLLRGEGSWNVFFSRVGGLPTQAGTQGAEGSPSSGGIFHTGIAQ
ncbi:MAG TPA: hypothetical protein VJG64_03475 [Candidatus Paceibacterota bacterium]